MPTILIVDDNSIDRERVRRLLDKEHIIVEAATVHTAMEIVDQSRVDCVILDQRLPDGEGIDILSALVSRKLPVLMLTAQGNEQLAVQAMKYGARDYVPKHELSSDALVRAIAHALELARLEGDLAAHQEQLEASNKALEEREAKLKVVLAQMPAIVWTTTPALRYAWIDGAALGPLGVEAASWIAAEVRGGVPGADSETEAVRAHVRALSGESARYTARAKQRDFECLVEPLRGKDGSVCGTIGVAMDTTEAHRREQELRQSQKMEAVGMLAGGVAHDFNNLLTAIVGFAGFVREALPQVGPISTDLDQVIIAANRGRALVKQLLAFSRRQPVEARVVPVNGVLTDMSAMLRRMLGADIELQLQLSPEAGNVNVDVNGLEQVIANLAINARDAMPNGGRLTLATENLATYQELMLAKDRRVAAGEHVLIVVTDTGTGIPAELSERIFEPFFTTKEVGKGTGLGLSTCHGIITQAGGTIEMQSELGSGTTFRIYLPRVRATVNSESAPSTHDALRGGCETVLVVEDDDQVRALIVRLLGGFGYQTLEAATGRRALELLQRAEGCIDLVLTDVVMPELGGFALAEALCRNQPNTRILFMSGYHDALRHERAVLQSGTGLMYKPVTADSLARHVRAALDATPADSAGYADSSLVAAQEQRL